MRFFDFLYRMSQKGSGFSVLYAFLLSAIFAVSIVIVTFKGIVSIDSAEEAEKFEEEFGCNIYNYELSCNEDYYLLDKVIIDLREDSEVPIILDGTVLTRDKVITRGSEITYKELFALFNHSSSDFTYEDGVKLIKRLAVPILFIGFIIMTFLTWIGHLIFNFLRALINKLLSKGLLEEKCDYNYFYKLTMYAVTPLVIINAITRLFFSETVTGYLTSFIPVGSGLIKLALDSMIILYFTKLILTNKDKNDVMSGTK